MRRASRRTKNPRARLRHEVKKRRLVVRTKEVVDAVEKARARFVLVVCTGTYAAERVVFYRFHDRAAAMRACEELKKRAVTWIIDD